MFCDSDDAYGPQMCEKMVSAVETNGTEMAVCGFSPRGGLSRYYKDNARLTENPCAPFLGSQMNWGNVWLWNKIFRRDVIDRTGLAFPKSPDVRRGYDAFFTFLYAFSVGNATFLADRLVEHYRRNGSITSLRRGMKLRSTLDEAAFLPRILDFVDRNGLYSPKSDEILRWLDFRIGKSIEFCNPAQRAEAIRLFAEALSSRSGDIRPEHRWLSVVLSRDERAVVRRLRFQRVADMITIVLERLGLRVWLRDLLFGPRPSSPSGR